MPVGYGFGVWLSFRGGQPFHVTALVDGLPVLVGSGISGEIYKLIADMAAYF
jgi:hypothetical protein